MNLEKFMNNLNQDTAETIKHLNSLKHSDPMNPGRRTPATESC